MDHSGAEDHEQQGDGGDALLRGEAGGQTGQESRSAVTEPLLV